MLSLNFHKNRTQKSSLLYSLVKLFYLTASGFRSCCGFYFEVGFDSVDEFIKKQTSLCKNSKSELLLKKNLIVLTVFGPHSAWQPLSGAEWGGPCSVRGRMTFWLSLFPLSSPPAGLWRQPHSDANPAMLGAMMSPVRGSLPSRMGTEELSLPTWSHIAQQSRGLNDSHLFHAWQFQV